MVIRKNQRFLHCKKNNKIIQISKNTFLDYVLKTDDDSYVRLDRLHYQLDSIGAEDAYWYSIILVFQNSLLFLKNKK